MPTKTSKPETKAKKKTTRPKSITSRENGKKGGAPSKQDKLNIDKMCQLVALGSTNQQLAIALNVSRDTIIRYKKTGRFCDSVKASEDYAKSRVKRAMFQRAIGYTHAEEKIFCNAHGRVTKVKTIKHYPPDTNAGNIWLNNKEEDWKPGTNTVNVTNTNVNKIENNVLRPEDVTDEHRQRLAENIGILKRNGLLNDKTPRE